MCSSRPMSTLDSPFATCASTSSSRGVGDSTAGSLTRETSFRATGVGVPYAITVSIFGGTAPVVALWFKQAGHETWFYWYLAGMILVSLLVYLSMRDTKTDSAMHRHE